MNVSVRRHVIDLHQLRDRRMDNKAPRSQDPQRRLSRHGMGNGTRLSATSVVWSHWKQRASHTIDQPLDSLELIDSDLHISPCEHLCSVP
jgi:hypothetical protein